MEHDEYFVKRNKLNLLLEHSFFSLLNEDKSTGVVSDTGPSNGKRFVTTQRQYMERKR